MQNQKEAVYLATMNVLGDHSIPFDDGQEGGAEAVVTKEIRSQIIQVVMEGFMNWRIRPWLRRFITRMLAIIPAIVVIGLHGDSSVNDLLTLSQVILAMQLPFAMFPLLHFTSSKEKMGKWKLGWFLLIAGWCTAITITVMDIISLPGCLKTAWAIIHG